MTQRLTDNWGRPINYLRLAVTDRCNLRCFYCMPEEGIKYMPKRALLSYEEMEHLVSLFCQLGVDKVRITGGEPLLRKDIVPFLYRLSEIDGLKTMNMTTNGLLTLRYLDDLKKMGLKSINLSLDSLDRKRFKKITRRDEFNKVFETLEVLKISGIETKINMVVMEGKNTEDIVPMAELSLKDNISVRFIEEMPFNGESQEASELRWTNSDILKHLQNYFTLEKVEDPKHTTAAHYKIAGAKGNLGIIAAYTRTFCGSCNRIRLTAQGELRTCLYANKGLNLKQMLRDGYSDNEIKDAICKAINNRHKDGFEAEKDRSEFTNWESMSTIGG